MVIHRFGFALCLLGSRAVNLPGVRDDTTAAPEHLRAEHFRADADLLAHTASRMLDVWRTLTELTRPATSSLDTDAYAYGSLRGAAQLWRAEQESLAELESTLERLGQVLTGDVDRLYRVAFAVRESDQAAAARLHAAGAG